MPIFKTGFLRRAVILLSGPVNCCRTVPSDDPQSYSNLIVIVEQRFLRYALQGRVAKMFFQVA
jgi:hypothetical protein